MPSLEIHPFSDEFLDGAATLLAERHRRHRLVEPLLPQRYEHPAAARAAIEELLGSDERRRGRDPRRARRRLPDRDPQERDDWGANVWVEPAGHAVEDAEDARDLYAAAAAAGSTRAARRTTRSSRPRTTSWSTAWFRLGFGQQHAYGIRELPDAAWPDGVREVEERDIEQLIALEPRTADHQRETPVFSGLPPADDDPDERRADILEDIASPTIGSLVAERDGRIVGNLIVCPLELSTGTHYGLARPRARFVPRLRGDRSGRSRQRRRAGADACRLRVGARARLRGDGDGLARHEPALVAVLDGARVPADVPAPASPDRVTRIPLLADARLVVADAGPTTSSLRPRRPPAPLGDVSAAAREALAFPLAGPPLRELVRRGGTATIVIEQPVFPIPGAPTGPRHTAIAAVADELARMGVAKVTILVAGGLLRRTTPREIGSLVTPEFRRRFRGRLIVHDVEADDLVDLGDADDVWLRANRALVDTDVVVTVTAAETVLHGGPAALLGATGRESLLQPADAVAARAEHLTGLAARPRGRAPAGRARRALRGVARARHAAAHRTGCGYPFDQAAIERLLGSRSATPSPACARRGQAPRPRTLAARDHGGGGVRRDPLGRAR